MSEEPLPKRLRVPRTSAPAFSKELTTSDAQPAVLVRVWPGVSSARTAWLAAVARASAPVPSPLLHVTVATLNVEFFRRCGAARLCSHIADRLGDADVLCLQEDLVRVRTRDGTVVSKALPLPGYTLVAQGVGESMGQAGLGHMHHLANSTYVRHRYAEHVASSSVVLPTPPDMVPRCAAVTTLASGTCIANVHLSGGRYDDKQADRVRLLKTGQLRATLGFRPDIVLGDFNGQPLVPDTDSMKEYVKSLGVSEYGFVALFTGGHVFLRQRGYAAVPLDPGASTSMFGTTPDWVYYRPERLEPTRVRVEDFVSGDALTDHNAIVATFRVKG